MEEVKKSNQKYRIPYLVTPILGGFFVWVFTKNIEMALILAVGGVLLNFYLIRNK